MRYVFNSVKKEKQINILGDDIVFNSSVLTLKAATVTKIVKKSYSTEDNKFYSLYYGYTASGRKVWAYRTKKWH